MIHNEAKDNNQINTITKETKIIEDNKSLPNEMIMLNVRGLVNSHIMKVNENLTMTTLKLPFNIKQSENL